MYSVIGPINRKDLTKDQAGLGLMGAFPDIEIDTFGYTIDPENPYRCLYFQRWRATHSQDMNVYGTIYPATGMEMETPLSTFSVVWNPDGKIVYERKWVAFLCFLFILMCINFTHGFPYRGGCSS